MPLKTHHDELPELNLTPMIDIVFLLIIFFMVGTKFTEPERRIELRIPEVADRGALTAAPQKREISVFRDGTIALDGVSVTIGQLKDRLIDARAEYSDLGVVVRGDARSEYQCVASVLNACKQVGIRDLGISVRLVPEEP